jgi:hypothetical protein
VAKRSNTRERLLLLYDILSQESDASHPIPLARLTERLEQAGFSVTRKSLYRDLEALGHSPLRVRHRQKAPEGWYAEGPLPADPPSPQTTRQALDRIHTALLSRRALAFCLRQHGPSPCLVSPKGLLWLGERYQLVGWDHHADRLSFFPLERMESVVVTCFPSKDMRPQAQQSSGK